MRPSRLTRCAAAPPVRLYRHALLRHAAFRVIPTWFRLIKYFSAYASFYRLLNVSINVKINSLRHQSRADECQMSFRNLLVLYGNFVSRAILKRSSACVRRAAARPRVVTSGLSCNVHTGCPRGCQ